MLQHRVCWHTAEKQGVGVPVIISLMAAELMQEYRGWRICCSGDHCCRLRLCSAGGDRVAGTLLCPLASALPFKMSSPSLFCFPALLSSSFPQLPVLQAFSPASLLTFLLCLHFFPLGPFFSSLAFSAMHSHSGVSLLPVLPSICACLLSVCSVLRKLLLPSCSSCPKSPAKWRQGIS